MNLNQVTILSEKPVETGAFFEKLGLRLIVDSLPRYARLECPDGESTLSVNIADTVLKCTSPHVSKGGTSNLVCSALTNVRACALGRIAKIRRGV